MALAMVAGILGCQGPEKRDKKVLVFSKTEGFRHESIPVGIQAIKDMGAAEGFQVDATENAEDFNEENLQQYAAVVFLSTTGDVLNYQQQAHFERYIQAGGGYLGIHAAADTEYDWPWYGQLVGGYFTSHPNNPNVREATCNVVDHGHQASDSLPDSFQKVDEFYNYNYVNDQVNVLVTIDESTYEGGTNGDYHPMVWYHEYDGGRAFYTAFGHTDETYSEPEFLEQLSGGLNYVMADAAPLDYALARYEPMPESNRFIKVVLDYNLNEPTEMAVLPDGRVLFLERKGNVKLYKPDMDSTLLIQTFDCYYGPGTQPRHEDGMLGLAIDPNFEENNWVYIFYSPNEGKPVQNLSRFEFKDDNLVMDSEIVMLEVPVQREQCCHTGGSVAFGPDGNLFLSTGDDTNPFESDGFSPSDEGQGRSPWDAQKSSSNTNDLRGKILRITPQPDGSYTIPDGNLFPVGTPNTKPEIFVMGCRNPYRIAVDQKSGYLYWGDVGPDAGETSEVRGPFGIDEFNQARAAGFYGWPYFTGNNRAYSEYDFQAKTAGAFHDPAKPINNSPNNTGLQELPPAQEAMIYYSYGASEEWPILGTGGKNPMAGPIFYADLYPDSPYPAYFEGKPVLYEWMRDAIFMITLDDQGKLEKIEPFMSEVEFANPMDMEYGPDGKLYLLEYGSSWFTQNMDARLVRIDYESGNRAPIPRFVADKMVGAAPLTVNFNSEESEDYDGDEVQYSWEFQAGATSEEAHPQYTFEDEGVYEVSLTLTDPQGESSTETMTIEVGNDPPNLEIALAGNQTFYWDNRSIEYEVSVTDHEDGSLAGGEIDASEVAVSMTYLEEATKETIKGHQSNDEAQHSLTGSRLISESDCKACHNVDQTSVGPSYTEIAKKYHKDPQAEEYLSSKIIKGGGGVWGENAMAAHPDISESDAASMVRYILSLAESKKGDNLQVKGNYTASDHIGKGPGGAYILKAVYTDKGGPKTGSATGSKTFTLRDANIKAVDCDEMEGGQIFKNDDAEVVILSNPSSITFTQMDLTGVKTLTFAGFLIGNEGNTTLEVHLGSADGPLVASTTLNSVGIQVQQGIFAAQSTVAIEETQGVHDVYIVAKGSIPNKPLGGLSTVSFQLNP